MKFAVPPPKSSGPRGLACWPTQTVTTDFSPARQTSNCISRSTDAFASPTLSLGPRMSLWPMACARIGDPESGPGRSGPASLISTGSNKQTRLALHWKPALSCPPSFSHYISPLSASCVTMGNAWLKDEPLTGQHTKTWICCTKQALEKQLCMFTAWDRVRSPHCTCRTATA